MIRVVPSSDGGFFLSEHGRAVTDTFPDRESAEDWRRTLVGQSKSPAPRDRRTEAERTEQSLRDSAAIRGISYEQMLSLSATPATEPRP